MRMRAALLVAGFPLFLDGCTTFATVRSAGVPLGPSVGLQASMSTPPGDVASWFWAYDCAQECNHPVGGGDVGFTYGWHPRGARAVALGVGISGVHPYLDGYIQLAEGQRPFGVGARIGPPVTSWREHQLYARYDIPVGGSTRVLLNPAIFLHEGRAPNGASPGWFLGLVQGVGLQHESENISWTPSVAVVAARAQRNSYGRQYGPEASVFATASLGVTLHRARALRAP